MDKRLSQIFKTLQTCKVHHNQTSLHKRIQNILKKERVVNIVHEIYKQNDDIKKPILNFFASLIDKLEQNKPLNQPNDSIKFFLQHNFLEYTLLTSNDENIKKITSVVKEIMQDYDCFLLIVSLLDDDPILSSVVKILIGFFNSKLLCDKIFVKPFLNQFRSEKNTLS